MKLKIDNLLGTGTIIDGVNYLEIETKLHKYSIDLENQELKIMKTDRGTLTIRPVVSNVITIK